MQKYKAMSLPLIFLSFVSSAALMPAAQTAQENMPAALAPTGLAHQSLQHISSVSNVIGLCVLWVWQQQKMAPLQIHQYPRWWYHTASRNIEINDLSGRCHHRKTERKAWNACFMKTKIPDLVNAGDHSCEFCYW